MATVIYLEPSDATPQAGENEPWLMVEPFDRDGKFYGSGASYKSTGEWVGYASIAENDMNLEKALAAAQEWAEKYKVPTIYVRTEPERDDAQRT